MPSGFLRRGYVVAWMALGFWSQGHAGPIRLDDLPPAVAVEAVKPDSEMSFPASPSVSSPARSAVDAGSGRVRSGAFPLDPGEPLLRQERPEPARPARGGLPVSIDMQYNTGTRNAGTTPRVAEPSAALPVGNYNAPIKDLALATLDWAREMLPWKSARTPNIATSAMPAPVDNLVLPVEGPASTARTFAVRAERDSEDVNEGVEAPRSSVLSPSNLNLARPQATGTAADDPIGRCLRFVREVIANPLIWVVIVLVGVTRIAISRRRHGKK